MPCKSDNRFTPFEQNPENRRSADLSRGLVVEFAEEVLPSKDLDIVSLRWTQLAHPAPVTPSLEWVAICLLLLTVLAMGGGLLWNVSDRGTRARSSPWQHRRILHAIGVGLLLI